MGPRAEAATITVVVMPLRWFAEIFGHFAVDSPYTAEWLARGWVDQATCEQIRATWTA